MGAQTDHREETAVHIDVKYAGRVAVGDMFAGTVNRVAPTRPCQPCASAMRVETVETFTDANRPHWHGYRFHFGPSLASAMFDQADQVLVIAGA